MVGEVKRPSMVLPIGREKRRHRRVNVLSCGPADREKEVRARLARPAFRRSAKLAVATRAGGLEAPESLFSDSASSSEAGATFFHSEAL